MADSNNRKMASIPSWQRDYVQNTLRQPEDASSIQPEAPPEGAASPRDSSTRDAPLDQKDGLLESKDSVPDEVERTLEAQSENHSAITKEPQQELKTVHDSTTSTNIQTSAPNTAAPLAASNQSHRDIPPVITYPEFLLKPVKPPPLITIDRLANVSYALGGLVALTYGTSEFLVKPMLESMTSARHELADTTLDALSKLNSKLETSVSHVPVMIPGSKNKTSHTDPDLLSETSDPTELFHHDIGTQTTPPRSRSASNASSSSSDSFSMDPYAPHLPSTKSRPRHTSKNINKPEQTLQHQTSRLTSLKTLLTSLTTSTSTHFASDSLDTSLADTQSYLDDLQTLPYSAPKSFQVEATKTTYTYPDGRTEVVPETNTKPVSKNTTQGLESGRDREAAKFKQEIRALKGVFLSSRNFPMATGIGGRAGVGGGAVGQVGGP